MNGYLRYRLRTASWQMHGVTLQFAIFNFRHCRSMADLSEALRAYKRWLRGLPPTGGLDSRTSPWYTGRWR